jgi:superfamily II DNA or RNA helicase
MSDINIHYFNETYIQILCDDRGILEEIADYFTFFAPNYQFHPKYKFGMWDGKLRLVERTRNLIYKGLLKRVIKFCVERKYKFNLDPELKNPNPNFDITPFINHLQIKSIKPYEFQIKCVDKMIKEGRLLVESSTGSGKSFIMYAVMRWLIDNCEDKILLLVPSVDLVTQLTQEFKDYSDYDIEQHIHQIYAGQNKKSDKKIFISTWQSIDEMPKGYFEQFGAIMGDEAHGVTAATCKKIFENCINAKYRYGLTGTVKDAITHVLVLEGLTGSKHTATTNKEMQDLGRASKLIIKAYNLKYPDITKQELKKERNRASKNLQDATKVGKHMYDYEMNLIVNHVKRNEFIADICKNIGDENVLVLTHFVKHLEILKKYIESTGKRVHIVQGKTKTAIRTELRKYAETENGIVILATYGVYSQGVNIKNLQHCIFATPYKGKVRVLQSIGRILRLDGKKNLVYLYDLIDNMSTKDHKNVLMRQFFERLKLYVREGFDRQILDINI